MTSRYSYSEILAHLGEGYITELCFPVAPYKILQFEGMHEMRKKDVLNLLFDNTALATHNWAVSLKNNYI